MVSYVVTYASTPNYGWCGPGMGFTNLPELFIRYVSKDVAVMAAERIAELVSFPTNMRVCELFGGFIQYRMGRSFPVAPECECGAAKCGSRVHSSLCPMN